MKRVLLTAGVLALGLALATPALAQRRGGNRGGFPKRAPAPKITLPKTNFRTPLTRKLTVTPRTRFTPRPTFTPKRTFTPKTPPRGTVKKPLPFPKTFPHKKTLPRKRVIVGKGHHFKKGHKFTHGHYYKGHGHYHWKYVCWSRKYGCKCYYCPSAACWYYYHPAQQCYYPITYLTVAPPPAVEVPADAPLRPAEFTPEELPPAPDEAIAPPPVPE